MAETKAGTPQSSKRRVVPWESLNPGQLSDLSRAYRKAGMKQTEDPEERQRLFHQANLLRGAAKLKAKRLAKEASN